jgi:arylsulfatase A-like enzyme/Tfp pilus assembly protein PilF
MYNEIMKFRLPVIAAAVLLLSAAAFGAAETNLLLVTVDTLRPDRLGCYSRKYVRTPAVDALAAQGVLFAKAFAHNPTTLPSHTNILLGTTPLAHGVSENSKARVDGANLTLAEHLKARGYATGAFVGAFPLDSRFGLNQGFDVYDDRLPSRPSGMGTYSERRAEAVVSAASAWISRQSGKWFCWVHLWDPHAPYAPPEPFLSEYADDPYSGEAAYVDSELAVLFGEIGKRGQTDRTLVVLTADHGESLGEHGEMTHSYFAYNSTIHVPLVIAGPGVKAGTVAENVGHIDIFPTVCELLGVKPPPSLQGVSLVAAMNGKKAGSRPIYFESLEPHLNSGCAPLRGFIEGSTKFMDSPVPEVYALDGDFEESKNLAETTDLAPLRKTLEEMETSLSSALAREGSRIAGRETLERLRSLGYTATPAARTKAEYGPEDDLKNFLPYQQRLERAILLSDGGRAEDGIRELVSLTRERTDFGPAYTYLSQFYMSTGRTEEAIRTLDDAVRLNPEDYSLLTAFGTLLVQTGQGDRAAEILEKAISLIDDDPEVWDNLGIVSMRKEDYPKALEYFERAIELDETFALAYSNVGAVRLTLFMGRGKRPEDLDLAIENFRRAVDLDPRLNLALRGLGLAVRTTGDIDGAIDAWEKAIDANPNDDFSTYQLALAHLEKGEKAKALDYCRKYLTVKGERITPQEREMIQALMEKCK